MLSAASGRNRHRDHDIFGVFAVGPGPDRHREHDTFGVFAVGPSRGIEWVGTTVTGRSKHRWRRGPRRSTCCKTIMGGPRR